MAVLWFGSYLPRFGFMHVSRAQNGVNVFVIYWKGEYKFVRDDVDIHFYFWQPTLAILCASIVFLLLGWVVGRYNASRLKRPEAFARST